jgi:hypothetical protein
MTLLGTFLVVRSRRDLAAGHTWSGYRMEAEAFTARGIYAWIRHPLYAGIFVVVSGSLCSILPRIDLSLSLALPVAARNRPSPGKIRRSLPALPGERSPLPAAEEIRAGRERSRGNAPAEQPAPDLPRRRQHAALSAT